MSVRFAMRCAIFSVWAGAALGGLAQAPHQGAHSGHGPAASVGGGAAPAAASGQPALDAHTREDMERHHSMARAHSQAAQCLAAGQPPEQCQKQLQQACKGLALGKNCGMRHSH